MKFLVLQQLKSAAFTASIRVKQTVFHILEIPSLTIFSGHSREKVKKCAHFKDSVWIFNKRGHSMTT